MNFYTDLIKPFTVVSHHHHHFATRCKYLLGAPDELTAVIHMYLVPTTPSSSQELPALHHNITTLSSRCVNAMQFADKMLSDAATDWMILPSNPGRGSRLVNNAQSRPPLTQTQPAAHRVLSSGIKRPAREADRSTHLKPRLRMGGAIPLLPLHK